MIIETPGTTAAAKMVTIRTTLEFQPIFRPMPPQTPSIQRSLFVLSMPNIFILSGCLECSDSSMTVRPASPLLPLPRALRDQRERFFRRDAPRRHEPRFPGQIADFGLWQVSFEGVLPGGPLNGLSHGFIVRVGVRAGRPRGFKEVAAEVAVVADVFFGELRSLSGHPVGPGEYGELFGERPRRLDQSLRRVVGSLVAHEPYFEVQRGEGDYRVGLKRGDPELQTDRPGKYRPHRIVRDEHDAASDLTARNGLRYVVQERGEEERVTPFTVGYLGPDDPFGEFVPGALDDLEDVSESVKVVVRTLLHAPGEAKFRHKVEDLLVVVGGYERWPEPP